MNNRLIALYKGLGLYVSLYVILRARLLDLDYYRPFLPAGGTLIDIGCGYGLAANYLALCFPDMQVIGIDLNPQRIKVALKTVNSRKNIEFLCRDATEWPMQNCEAVIMTDFLHHVAVQNQAAILQLAFNNLHRDGVLLIAEVNPKAKPAYKYWQSALADRILYPHSRCYFRTPPELENTLRNIGFDVSTYRPKSNFFAKIVYICRK